MKDGIRSLSELAERSSAELLELLRTTLDEPTARKLGPLDEARVKVWIDSAKEQLGKT